MYICIFFTDCICLYKHRFFSIYHEHFLIPLKNTLKYYLKYSIPMVVTFKRKKSCVYILCSFRFISLKWNYWWI